MLIGNRSGFIGVKSAKLPYDAEVEYLESTGTQYILFDESIDGFDGMLLPSDSNAHGAVGIWNGGSRGDTIKYTTTNSRGWVVSNANNSNPVYSMNMDNSRMLRVVVDGTSVTIGNDSFTMGTAWGNYFINVQYFGLFGCWNANAADFTTLASRIGTCKIYYHGNLLHDLIPVRIGTEGAMYDKVSGQLFRNQGTGAFLYGGDVYSVPVETSQYVQNGLVAMWDGKENAGVGKHNDSPTEIADLAGSSPLEIIAPISSSVIIGADYFSSNGIYSGSIKNSTTTVAKDAITNGAATIEVCCYCGEYGGGATPIRCGSDNNTALYSADNYVFKWLRIRGSLANVSDSSMEVGGSGSFSIRVGGDGTALFRNGTYAIAASVGTQTIADGIEIGYGTAGKWKFYSVRLYNRALTAEEIAANYAVDAQRFNLPAAS